jgi:membrane fusion protein, heavy metal efflux system
MNKIFLMISISALISCGSKNKADEVAETSSLENIVTLTDAQLKNAGIETEPLQDREISSVLKVNGKIDVPPQNMVSISVPLGGYLKTTKLLPGMHVNKGEVIAVVEDQQYIQLQQDYLTAKARINFLENEYKRQRDLNEGKASSDKVYQQAEADYKTQRVLIASLAQKLQLAGINPGRIGEENIVRGVNLYSPINGYVTKVNVNIGKYVSPTDVLFELVNPTDIHLALKVFEKDINKLFIGQKLYAFTNNQSDKKYLCEILLIGKGINEDGSTEIHCHFETYDKTLIPGTYMNAEIEVKSMKSAALPSEAVVRYQGKHYVYVKKDRNKFEMKEVNIGETENGFTELSVNKSDTALNKDYVIKGAYTLLMKMKNKEE